MRTMKESYNKMRGKLKQKFRRRRTRRNSNNNTEEEEEEKEKEEEEQKIKHKDRLIQDISIFDNENNEQLESISLFSKDNIQVNSKIVTSVTSHYDFQKTSETDIFKELENQGYDLREKRVTLSSVIRLLIERGKRFGLEPDTFTVTISTTDEQGRVQAIELVTISPGVNTSSTPLFNVISRYQYLSRSEWERETEHSQTSNFSASAFSACALCGTFLLLIAATIQFINCFSDSQLSFPSVDSIYDTGTRLCLSAIVDVTDKTVKKWIPC